MTIVATMSATSVNAVGHVTRPEFADFNIGRCALSVFFSRYSSKSVSTSKEKEADFRLQKKVPPPTPDGREGRLFPPEQSSKALRLLNELQAGRNNFFYVKISRDCGPAPIGHKRDQTFK
jgi:hypothetical protein